MKKLLVVLPMLLLSIVLTGCSPNLSSNVLNAGEVGTVNKTASGVIISKRAVQIDNNSRVGGLVGTGGGALAGSLISHNTTAQIAGALGGAVLGGVIGNALDQSIHSQIGYEYVIRLQNHQVITVTQTQDTNLFVGQKVMVIYGPRTRLIPDNT